jgi:hypothetical protein
MNIRLFLCLSAVFIAACVPPYSPTGEKDPTAPQVAAVIPADGAIDVAPETVVTVTFSGPIDPTTVTAYSFRLIDKAGEAVTGTVALSADGLTATMTPAAPFTEGGAYTVEISRQIQDPDGIPLDIGGVDTLFVSTFSVLATPPTVLSVNPSDEATASTALTEVTVFFSEAMNPATLTQATVLVSDLQGIVSYDAETMSVRFTIEEESLVPHRTYTIFIAGTVTDSAGIPMGADVVSTFTVE